MRSIRRLWRWISTTVKDRYTPGRPIVRTPLDVFDEAIGNFEDYIIYLEMELSERREHDDEDDFCAWESFSLSVAVDLIRDVIARLEVRQSRLRSGQERATSAGL